MYTTPIEKSGPVNIRHLLGVTAASLRSLTSTRGKGLRWGALILFLTCGLFFMMGGAGLARAVTDGPGIPPAAGLDNPRHPADARPLPGRYIDGSVPQAWRLTAALDRHSNGRGFHLFSHGRPGELFLGGRWRSAGPIAAFVRRLPGFSGRGTLHIYGCSFAAGEKGREAVRYLEQALGVPVAASDDVTGKNGDWDLEVGRSASAVRAPAYTRSLQTDTDGDGVPDSSDLDDDNDGILDTDEGTCSVGSMSFATFDSDNANWVEDNLNNGNVGNPVAHSSDNTTTFGCPMSSIPASPNGNFIAENDEDSYLMWFESPDNLNLDYSSLLGGELSFYWINGTFDGTGAQSTRSLSVILHGGGLGIRASVSVDGLHNSGSWHKLTFRLDDATWSGTAADLATVLSDLDKAEIQVESISDRVRDCTNGEYFGLDDVVFACGNPDRDTDGDGIPDHRDPDSDNDGCPDAIEGDRSPTYDFGDLIDGGSLDPAQHPVNGDGVPGGVTQGGGGAYDGNANSCTDYGDAPESYGTSSAGTDPAVSTIATDPATLQPALYLGAGVDFEADGRPGAAAEGDDTDNRGDDEDGVTFSHDKQARTFTATATAANRLSEAARVCCWLDGGMDSAAGAANVDGTFEATPAEERCAAVPANSGSADYTLAWYFPAASATTTYARCRIAAASTISPTGALADGEVEDYRVTVEIDPCDPQASGNTDTDQDKVSDICDLDDDNDGITDCVENGLQDAEFNDVFNLAGDVTGDPDNRDPAEVQLTPARKSQAGSAMSYGQVDFGQSFTVAFQAYFGTRDSGADGIAMVFHNDPDADRAVGGRGQGIGASGLRDGIALEMDTYHNFGADSNDIANDHAAIWETDQVSGQGAPLSYLTALTDLGNIEDGNWHDVQISWDPGTQTLEMRFDGTPVAVLAPFDHQTYFGGADRVTFGMSAATGSYTNDQRIRFVDFCKVPLTLDTDGDGLPNHLDLDSDGDGISDLEESGASTSLLDPDGNGEIDGSAFGDTGIIMPDGLILANAGNGLADVVESIPGNGLDTGTDPENTDRYNTRDNTPDFRDRDADADGCPDAIEGDRSPTFDFGDIVDGGSLDPAQYPSTTAGRGRHGWPAEPLQGGGNAYNEDANPCTDYGDAPDSYQTSIFGSSNSAASTIATDPATLKPALYIGTGVDIDADGRPGANADGDDTDSQGDDEGGVVFHYSKQVITATVAVENNLADPARVCCWLDGGTASAAAPANVNGTFEATPAEERCADVPANSGSARYMLSSWNFPVTAATATYARCRVFRFVGFPILTISRPPSDGPTGWIAEGEVEDYYLPVRPTSATVGAFSAGPEPVEDFLAQISARDDLLALLEQYDPALAETLAGAGAGALQEALTAFMDPDGDGLLAVARWETLEERGTMGFYLERRGPGAAGFTRVNPALLLGLIDAPHGGQYWLVDPGAGARGTYRYRLVEQKAWGTQQTYDPEPVHVGPGQSGRQARRLTEERGEAASAFGDLEVLGQGYGARRREPQPPQFAKVAARLAARLSVQAEGLAAAQKSTAPSRKNWLYTDQPGLYRLTVDELAGLTGMSARTVSRRLAQGQGRLMYQNESMPYHFDADRGIFYFVGTAYRTLYTDENAYRLISSRHWGTRMAVAAGDGPGAGAAVGTFTETLTIEEDAIYSPAFVYTDDADVDYWFYDYIAKGRKGYDPMEVGLDLPDAAAAGPMLLRLHIRGVTNFVPEPDHRVRVALNGTELGLWEWDGLAEEVLETEVDQSLLRPEGNVLTLKSEASDSFQFFNRVVVRYRRLMRARAGSLWLDALPAGIHTVDGFDKDALVVIESPGTPEARWRKDITVAPSPGGGYEVSFAAARTADYLVAEADSALTPRVSADRSSRWRRRRSGTDYLIIAPRELSKTAKALKSYREERFAVTIAWLEDIYDEFSYGRVDAGALEDFLFRVGWRWRPAPEYVVLLGKGTLAHRGDQKGHSDSLIPVRMTATPWGLYASDNRYADTDGDGVAEFALGRIPVSHDSEGLAYVAKLKAYEAAPSGAWMGRAVVAADDPDFAGNYHADSDVIVDDLAKAGYSVRRAYHPDHAVRDILTDSATWESAYVNYVGHSAISQLGHEGFLKSADAASLSNAGLPLFAAFTCAVGDDTYPGDSSVAGALVRNGGGGAVAALAPTGMSLDLDAHILNHEFVKGLTAERSLGDAWRESQKESLGRISPYMSKIYQVMGCPAVELKK